MYHCIFLLWDVHQYARLKREKRILTVHFNSTYGVSIQSTYSYYVSIDRTGEKCFMGTKATKEEWQKLYDLAFKFKEMEPWKQFYDTDIFCIRFSEEEAGYIDLMGAVGDDVAWSLFQGEQGLMELMGILFAKELDVPFDYLVREQNSLNLYLGDRDEVEQQQYQVIRDLGLKFRGKGSWIYFEMNERGYFPYLPDQQGVRTCIRYLEAFLNAVQYYEEHHVPVKFDEGEIFEYCLKDGEWEGRARSIVHMDYVRPYPVIADDVQAAKIKKAAKKKRNEILELDMFYLDNAVKDEEQEKVINLKMALLVEKESGFIATQRLINPKQDDISIIPSMLADWILKNGCPKKVLAANSLIEALASHVCETAGVPLAVGRLPKLEKIKSDLFRYLRGDSMMEEELPVSEEEEEDFVEGLLDKMGLDMQDLQEKAMTMSEEEFAKEAMSQMTEAMRRQGFSEDEIEAVLSGTLGNESGGDCTFMELKNRRQKIDAVMDFYGHGGIPEDIYSEFDKDIVIRPGKRAWEECLEEGRKDELYKIAKDMEADVNRSFSKGMLADAIIKKASLDSRMLSSCMSKEARKLLRLLRRKAAGQDAVWMNSGEFPGSMETVLELLALGLIDVGYGFDEDSIILEINPLGEENSPLGKFV